MIAQNPAHIYKADTRVMEFSEDYRCLSTFNDHTKKEENEASFGTLTVFEDETLAPGKRRFYYMQEDALVFLMPLVGLIEIEGSNDTGRQLLIPEEIKAMHLKKGRSFHVSNPYEKDLVNYLQIRIKGGGLSCKKSFGNYGNNTMFPILKQEGCHIHFGVFDGRQEAVYRLQSTKNGVFAFVINGAFELENRLLESRDGLTLWNTETVELEALSENAILLLLEVPLEKKL